MGARLARGSCNTGLTLLEVLVAVVVVCKVVVGNGNREGGDERLHTKRMVAE